MGELQDIVVEVLGDGDFETADHGHWTLNACWLSSGNGITVQTDTFAHKGWLGNAIIAFGKVTMDDPDWPTGTIFSDDILFDKLTTSDPDTLRKLLTTFKEW